MVEKVLVTGGAGYVGSHVCIALANNGYEPIIVDNLSNSKIYVVKKLNKIINKKVIFNKIDIRDKIKLKKIINKHSISKIIHLASLKSVEESLDQPFKYISNNISGLIDLLSCFDKNKLKQIIFSSSACVYGNTGKFPIKENNELKHENTYGYTKIVCEQIIENYCMENKCNYANLRYFNPSGCHESGLIGEGYALKDKSLMSNILRSIKNKKNKLLIFGSKYKTKDGTPERDFVHVMDVAKGHINALRYINRNKKNITCNLGSGVGTSVLEIIKNFEIINKVKINYKLVGKRKGDVEKSYACIKRAKKKLDWTPAMTISDISNSSYKWFLNNKKKN